MASNDDAKAEREERLKSALWYSIGQFVDEKTLENDLNATPQFIGALTELVYTQIANTARDLEVFSKHAGRNTINTDDVLLLGRRNEQLQGLLEKELEDIRTAEGRRADGQPVARAQPAAAGKKRGRPAGTGKGKAKA
ncbi:uncharacterized protein J4E88_006105 [Alternaria novae-zelandiae]|uniref:uncharacterized protein n=1 Tax=Alternaria triticimaculans TaxID=297637 RepID=UPI0020C34CA9|nr:uncharacterized protein J4E78_006125 [Alternaria triticimaculans]XP_049236818.1 uncharacterized protein J4E87_001807 [Alternaria ethzedia]XP_049247852.1 uncharacterized protein J4E84_001866 [Alternaria hordeiaustralica]XP_049254748.1 uncharacterized protein J4E88_006105 [Alternaria novae-zelandiae]XP_051302791.1 uncharacterized protein J4E86_005490 [Alternaria arbusti]XP_051325195.1 uncharacterized protein J4E85_006749 [Alternaria conjuncta]XP_051355072.1 uncharacterized protein J4E92_0033